MEVHTDYVFSYESVFMHNKDSTSLIEHLLSLNILSAFCMFTRLTSHKNTSLIVHNSVSYLTKNINIHTYWLWNNILHLFT